MIKDSTDTLEEEHECQGQIQCQSILSTCFHPSSSDTATLSFTPHVSSRGTRCRLHWSSSDTKTRWLGFRKDWWHLVSQGTHTGWKWSVWSAHSTLLKAVALSHTEVDGFTLEVHSSPLCLVQTLKIIRSLSRWDAEGCDITEAFDAPAIRTGWIYSCWDFPLKICPPRGKVNGIHPLETMNDCTKRLTDQQHLPLESNTIY